jgi:predicted ATPase
MTSLVGRDGDLEGLRAALGETRAGRGGFVLVTGEAGMGKTSVLNALARDAADAGAQVLFGSCMSMEDPRHCCRGRRWFGRG